MKKRSKALVLSLAAAVLLILLPPDSALTVRAEESATYSLKYFNDKGWRCQIGSEYVDGVEDADINYLNLYLKDGDNVVIYPGDVSNKELDLSAVKLNNLTVHQQANVVVKTNGIKDCYILAGSYCAINGDVTNAYLYDTVSCTFNNNVLDMTLYIRDNSPEASSIACVGTVGRFYVHSLASDSGKNVFYDVKTGGLIIQDGKFCIPSDKYSPTPTEEYTKAMEGSSAPVSPAPATPAPSTSNPAAPVVPNPDDQYDKVPKTGDSTAYLWLFLASAVFGAGSYALRRKTN